MHLTKTHKRILALLGFFVGALLAGYLIYTGSRLFETYAAQYLPEVIPTETQSYLSSPL